MNKHTDTKTGAQIFAKLVEDTCYDMNREHLINSVAELDRYDYFKLRRYIGIEPNSYQSRQIVDYIMNYCENNLAR